MLTDALINPLVVSTQQRQARLLRQLARYLLIEKPSLRCHQNDRPALINRFDSGEDRLRLHNHTDATTVGVVIDHVMFVGSGIADIVQGKLQQATLLSAFQDTLRKWPLKHTWEKCENVYTHKLYSPLACMCYNSTVAAY